MNDGTSRVSAPNSPGENTFLLLFCAILAVGVHAGILFAWNYQPKEVALIQVLGDSVEVALVESASAVEEPAPKEASDSTVSQPESPRPEPPPISPPPEPIPPTQVPEPVPVPTKPEPEPIPEVPAPVPIPEPMPTAKDTPPPVAVKEVPPIPKPKPTLAAAKVSQASKSADASAVKGTPEAVSRDSSGKVLGKPLYLVRPQVNYPSESRAAGEQGVVLLRITVNANGRPTAVNVTKGSGFSRLDRAAVEGGWRCRVSNAFEGAQFEAPLRFSLQDR
jgi:protein TonB